MILAISMGLRVIIEVPLCLMKRWRVAYGVTHDFIHAGAVIAGMCFFSVPGLEVWGALTLLSLASELIFVRWFVKATGGPGNGVYFVPGGEAFRSINIGTAIIFIPQAAGFIALLLLAMNSETPEV